MDQTRLLADLATIRSLAADIIAVDDDFSTCSADAAEISDMSTSLIQEIEKDN